MQTDIVEQAKRELRAEAAQYEHDLVHLYQVPQWRVDRFREIDERWHAIREAERKESWWHHWRRTGKFHRG